MRFLLTLSAFFLLSVSDGYAGDGKGYQGEVRLVFRNLEKFEEWPAIEKASSIATDIDWSSHKDSWNYRTRLREGLKKGVNYAGKYAVVTHGCGSSCQVNWIINVESGKVIDAITSAYGVKYREDSRLIIADLPLDKDNTIYLDEVSSLKPRFYIIGEDYLDPYWVIDFCDFKTGCQHSD